MSALEDLQKRLPGVRASEAPADRALYSRDLWPRELIRLRARDTAHPGPRAVVWPESTDQITQIIQYARESGTPLVPFGAGSGVCGGILPGERALVVDLKRIADYELHAENHYVDVGAGMLGVTLEEELNARGFTVGHFPSSILCSTVGGWLAARGAGQCSGLYGKIEDMVVGADCVLGDGSVVPMRWRRHGPNLAPLMIGSEGTLGIITRARLRLHQLPEAREFSAFAFHTVERGWEGLREIYQAGLRPAVARLYDPLDTVLNSKSKSDKGEKTSLVMRSALSIPRAINRAVRVLEGNLLSRCKLILIFEGPSDSVSDDAARARRVCLRLGASDLGEAPARAWLEHRYSVSYRQSPVFRMGAFSDTMEVAAPWSKLEAVYRDVRQALGRHVVVLSHLSHAYPDGCSIYFTFSAATESDTQALARYDTLWPLALEAAIKAGATLSHHHGVGRSKAPSLGAELGYGLTLMRRLKRAWDPDGIFNPGVLIPQQSPEVARAPGPSGERAVLDKLSLTADLDAGLTLDECENLLARQGFSLAVSEQGALSLSEWLARGMPGVRLPWEDPVDHTLVGLVAELADHRDLEIAPVPRRAVGPDLTQFFIGERRVGRVKRVTLRVAPVAGPRSRSLAGSIDSHDHMNDAEATSWERAVGELTAS